MNDSDAYIPIDESVYATWSDEQIQAHFRPAFVETALSRAFAEAAQREAVKKAEKEKKKAEKEAADSAKAAARAAKERELDRTDPVVVAACVVCGKPVRESKRAAGLDVHKACRKKQLAKAALALEEKKDENV